MGSVMILAPWEGSDVNSLSNPTRWVKLVTLKCRLIPSMTGNVEKPEGRSSDGTAAVRSE